MEETWVFEDSFVALETAHRAGFRTVGVYDRFGFRQDIMQAKSTVYIDENSTLMALFDRSLIQAV